MRVDNRIKIEATVQFQDLAVGDVYEDDEGVICIKTSGDDYGDSPYGKCIAFVNDEWCEEDEHRGTYVKPLEATITLHGYKRKARN
jgi:hypothetical protein